MKRINYLVTPTERLVGVALPTRIDAQLHRPLAGVVGALVLVGALHGAQQVRLADAARAANLYGDRLAAAEPAVQRVNALEGDVARLRQLARRTDEIHRSGAVQAARVAAIGDRVPGDAWLTTIRADHGGFTVEGRGARLSAIGATIAALGTLPAGGGVRLLDVHADHDRPGVGYAIAVDARR